MKLRKSVFFTTSAVVAMGIATIAGGCSSDNTTADSGVDTGVVDDTGLPDAKKDTGKDTAVADTGPMCPTPGDIGNFMHTYVPAKSAAACSNAQITSYVANCWMMGGNCQTYKQANAACAACMESTRKDSMTPNNDPKFGPVYIGNGLGFLNFSGCIELLGDMACAQATQALAFCTYAACDTTCSIPPETSANFNKCTQTATTAKCNMYNQAVTAACGTEAGAAANTACRNGFNTFQDGLIKFGGIFCGGAPSDAGTDG